MSRASRARRIVTTAAYGGGGLGLLGAAVFGVLFSEAKLARRWVGSPEFETAPANNGVWGPGTEPGPPLRMALLGDSSAAGLGVKDPLETPGVLIASGLSEMAERPVELVNVAVVGAKSCDLADQVAQVEAAPPDAALIMIGGNDVTSRVRPSESVCYLSEAVTRLRAAGAEVVVGTCPDLGTVRPIVQPLRFLVRQWSRQLAAAQTIATVEAGGRTVSLGDVLGPEFLARPREMFSSDRFHPSAEGYAAAAAVILPSICAALGVWPEEEDLPPRPFHREGVRPVAKAAARAAGVAGSEVVATQVDGRERGPRGRWVRLRRRRPRPISEPQEPTEPHEPDGALPNLPAEGQG